VPRGAPRRRLCCPLAGPAPVQPPRAPAVAAVQQLPQPACATLASSAGKQRRAAEPRIRFLLGAPGGPRARRAGRRACARRRRSHRGQHPGGCAAAGRWLGLPRLARHGALAALGRAAHAARPGPRLVAGRPARALARVLPRRAARVAAGRRGRLGGPPGAGGAGGGGARAALAAAHADLGRRGRSTGRANC